MTKGTDKIEMDKLDDSVYEDCSPLFSETHPFGKHYTPSLQVFENLEKHVHLDMPNCSKANLPEQSEGDLSNYVQRGKGGMFPVWNPVRLEEGVFFQPEDPLEDNGLHVDERILLGGVHLEENATLPPQDMIHQGLDQPPADKIATSDDHPVVDDIPHVPSQASEGQVALQPSRRRGRPRKLPSSAPQNTFEITRRPRTKRGGHKIRIHQELDGPMADTIATTSHHRVADDIPPGPSQTTNLLPRRRRGRLQKLPPPAPHNAFKAVRRPRTKSSGQEIRNDAWLKALSENGGWLNSVQNHHSVASEAPGDANLPSKRPCKLAAPNKHPRKRREFVLPDGWTRKNVPRKNGKFDSFYTEDATGHKCRSQVEVSRYLESKATQRGQMEAIPGDICPSP